MINGFSDLPDDRSDPHVDARVRGTGIPPAIPSVAASAMPCSNPACVPDDNGSPACQSEHGEPGHNHEKHLEGAPTCALTVEAHQRQSWRAPTRGPRARGAPTRIPSRGRTLAASAIAVLLASYAGDGATTGIAPIVATAELPGHTATQAPSATTAASPLPSERSTSSATPAPGHRAEPPPQLSPGWLLDRRFDVTLDETTNRSWFEVLERRETTDAGTTRAGVTDRDIATAQRPAGCVNRLTVGHVPGHLDKVLVLQCRPTRLVISPR